MNDTTLEKMSSSSLAVVEKKPQRPGGCVGIFFQLLDWNRRLAKKKLFSKKLLHPDRLKQSSKKFGGDEKQPKLRLIADENRGGFPNTKNNNVDIEQQHELRAPGLVARLMGLESMPTLQRDKSKKVPTSNYVRGKADKFVDNINGYSRDESNVEKGGRTKHELRPQKLQKTSVSERQPITKFGAEKLPPFKSILSKSRKHPHHPKLPSPVKSPRNISRKSSSKLIGAATRILEPCSRSKCALAYTNTLHHHPSQNTVMDERARSLSSQLEDSSCRNCGHRLNNLDSKPVVSGNPLIFASPFADCVGPSTRGSERNNPGNSAFYHQELREDYDGDLQSRVKFLPPFNRPTQRNSSSQHCKPPKAPPLSLNYNHKTQSQIQMLQARDTVPPRPKNSVSVNQSFSSSSTRPRMPSRMGNGKFDPEKRISNSPNDAVPPGRKRRQAIISRQGESAGFVNSNINKRNFGSPHLMSGKQLGYNCHFINRQCSRNGSLDLQERTVENGRAENNVVSFTFNSPVKQKSGIQEVDLHCDDSLPKLAFGENGGRVKLEKPFPLSGDALGALLQQKLKEFKYEGDGIECNGSRKTTSMILHELICALTSEKPFQQDNLPAISDRRNSWCNYSKLSNSTSPTSSPANAMAAKLSVEQPLDSERPSPGSVLEAYFSTESCHSSSLDNSLAYQLSGCKMLNESSDCSYSGPRSPNPDSELLDSAASMNNRAKHSNELVINILNHVSEILCCNIFASCALRGNKLDQAKEALLNAELILHNASISGAVVGKGCPIKHLLLHELETLASLLWMNFGNSHGIEDGKEASQLKEFVLDSIIEYLDERFGKYPKGGSKVSRKLPLRMNTNTLIFEIVEVVRKWDELSRYNNLDELIEREMSFALREWTECETEAFETGLEISGNVLQILVDEIVMDLWKYGS